MVKTLAHSQSYSLFPTCEHCWISHCCSALAPPSSSSSSSGRGSTCRAGVRHLPRIWTGRCVTVPTWELAPARGVPGGKWGRKTKILRLHRLLLWWWSKTPWWARPLPSTSYILLRVGGRLVGVWGQWRPSWSQVCRIQYRYALDNMISGKFNSYGIPESVSVVFQMIHLMKDRGLK